MSVWTIENASHAWGSGWRGYLAEPVAPYFRRFEFACRCGDCRDLNGHQIPPQATMHPQALVMALLIRQALGVPLHITSGVRCPNHNRDTYLENKQTPNPKSMHVPIDGFGHAFDFAWPHGMDKAEVLAVANGVYPSGGLGEYNWGIHRDTGIGKESGRRW